MNDIFVGLAIAAVVGACGLAFSKGREFMDQRAVVQWLRANTKDEPAESHLGTIEIAKGVSLPEDRVRHACMTSRAVYRAPGESDLWSVWREEPQSIYEKRGATFF